MKVIIVGGVAGGATAAARLRRLNEKAEIILIERDEYISYANCGLPYYIGDVIEDKEDLQVQTVEGMTRRFNLDIRVKSEVSYIDKARKKIKIIDLQTKKEYEESFDKLVLSCGAKAIKPSIAGMAEADNVFVIKNIPDTYKIKDYLQSNSVKNAVVIGGGFIGVEMAENLANLGVNVTIVEKKPQVLSTLDFEMAQIAHMELSNNKINLALNDGIAAFENGGKIVKLESGRAVCSDMTILAIGVAPENTLAKQANIKLGARGHVVTNENFNVYDDENEINKDIFAIGDMIEVINLLDDSKYAVALAWGANRQGKLVADYICGKAIKTSKILGANVIKVFRLTVASVGSNAETLAKKGIDFTQIHAHRANHASYYPGSSNISIKLLFDKTSGKIYGAQAVGREGVEKRIDVISAVMRQNGTVNDLSDIELCYAPPYSSAKDPINIMGYIAENVIDNVYNVMQCNQVDDFIKGGGLLIDVRTPSEYNNGHIDGAININVDTLRNNLNKILVAKDAPICLNCQVGQRSYLAIRILKANGYTNLYNLSGGYLTYKSYKFTPTPKTQSPTCHPFCDFPKQ